MIFFILISSYTIFFLLTLFPMLSIATIKQHDFGAYAIAITIYCILLIYTYSSKKKIRNIPIQGTYFIFTLSIIILGILLRCFALSASPFTTDLHRYLSDGLNSIQGNNPYNAPTIGKDVSYPHLRTIYPIFMQVVFYIGAIIWKSPYVFKYIMGGVEFILLGWISYHYIFYYSRKYKYYINRSSFLLLLFFLNPTLIFECYGEGHSEIISILFFLLSSHYLYKKKYTTSKFFAYTSILTKLHGILFIPIYLKEPKKFVSNLITIAIVFSIVFIPFFYSVDTNTSGLVKYSNYWYFNHFPTLLLKLIIPNTQYSIKFFQIVLLCLLGYFCLSLWNHKISTNQYLIYSIFSIIVLIPTQHPWYFLLLLYCILFDTNKKLLWACMLSVSGISYLRYLEFNWVFTSIYIWFMGGLAYYVQKK